MLAFIFSKKGIFASHACLQKHRAALFMLLEAFALHQSLAVAAGNGIFGAVIMGIFSLVLLATSIAGNNTLWARGSMQLFILKQVHTLA